MRKKIVGSSWKMHINSFDEASTLAQGIAERLGSEEEVDLFILPAFPLITMTKAMFYGTNIKFGAQNIAVAEKGAHTGEVPVKLVKELECAYVELNHAERRSMYNETDEMTAIKVSLCEQYGLTPIVCIGETSEDIERDRSRLTLRTQILWALENSSPAFREQIILAYEPVWAIGQAESASKEYIAKTHKMIRELVKADFNEDLSNKIRIIYGGSVSPETALQLSDVEDVDGLFVGRFGLQAENFEKIVNNFKGESR